MRGDASPCGNREPPPAASFGSIHLAQARSLSFLFYADALLRIGLGLSSLRLFSAIARLKKQIVITLRRAKHDAKLRLDIGGQQGDRRLRLGR